MQKQRCPDSIMWHNCLVIRYLGTRIGEGYWERKCILTRWGLERLPGQAFRPVSAPDARFAHLFDWVWGILQI